jgi:hypothetical protein
VIFALREAGILVGKKAAGRSGMDLWQILVLGIVRLGLDADWDRMKDVQARVVLDPDSQTRRGDLEMFELLVHDAESVKCAAAAHRLFGD